MLLITSLQRDKVVFLIQSTRLLVWTLNYSSKVITGRIGVIYHTYMLQMIYRLLKLRLRSTSLKPKPRLYTW